MGILKKKNNKCPYCEKTVWFFQDRACHIMHKDCYEETILIGISKISQEQIAIRKEVAKINYG